MARLSQLFAPKEREFFDLFEEAGANTVRATELLQRILEQWPDHGELGRDVLDCEHEGDRITHDIIRRLNQTFVTPIDREDIYALASALDDIVDFTEEVADYLGLYRIAASSENARAIASTPLRAWRGMPRPGRASDASRSRDPARPSRSGCAETTARPCRAGGRAAPVRPRSPRRAVRGVGATILAGRPFVRPGLRRGCAT